MNYKITGINPIKYLEVSIEAKHLKTTYRRYSKNDWRFRIMPGEWCKLLEYEELEKTYQYFIKHGENQ